MKKRKFLLLIAVTIGLTSIARSMEEKTELTLKELPAELHVAITQFLGDKILETLENIKRLSFTDSYFNNLIKEHMPVITKFIKEKFKEKAINDEFNAAIQSGDLHLLKLFTEFNLIDQAKRNRALMLGLNKLLKDKAIDLIMPLFTDKIIRVYHPRIRPTGGGSQIPLDYLYRAFRANQQNEEDRNKFKKLFEFLVDTQLWNVNELDPSGRTALMYALDNENAPVAEFLLEHGADLNLEVNKKALQEAMSDLKERAEENFRRDESGRALFEVLQKRGFIN